MFILRILRFILDPDQYLKDPFLLYESSEPGEKLLREKVYTVPLFNVLVSDSNSLDTQRVYKAWQTGLWIKSLPTRTVLMYFVLDIRAPNKISVMCENCDLCDPYKLILGLTIPKSKTGLDKLVAQTGTKFQDFPKISSNIGSVKFDNNRITKVWMHSLKYDKKRTQVLNTFMNFLDVYKLSTFAGANITVLPQRYRVVADAKRIIIAANAKENVPGCTGQIFIRGYTMPHIRMQHFPRRNQPDGLGIVSHSKHLRFISCHEEPTSWKTNAGDIFIGFDAFTWCGIIFSLSGCSLILLRFSIIYDKILFKRFHKSPNKATNQDATCKFLLRFLAQGKSVYVNRQIRKNGCFGLVIFTLFIMLNVLTFEYKGNFIGRLMMRPTPVQFKVYKDLVLHKFSIYVLPVNLNTISTNYGFSRKGQNYTQTNGHEAFPIVSLLFHTINQENPWYETLPDLLKWKKRSNATMFYVNTSQLFPNWRNVVSKSQYNSKELIGKYLQKCYKQAAIFDEYDAEKVYHSLLGKKKPVYFGKDIIYKAYHGFDFSGHLSTKFHKNIKRIMATGIFEWWNKFYKYKLAVAKHDLLYEDEHSPTYTGPAMIWLTMIGLCVLLSAAFLGFEIFNHRLDLSKRLPKGKISIKGIASFVKDKIMVGILTRIIRAFT